MAKNASNLVAGVVSMVVQPTTGKYGGNSMVGFNPPVNKHFARRALFAKKPFFAKPFGGVFLPMKSSTGLETHQVFATHEEAETVEAPVAFVTNANRGLGRAIALAYTKAGFKVILHCSGQGLEPEGMVDVYDEIMAMGGGDGLISQCDLSDKHMAAQTFEKALEEFGKVDILVHYSGDPKADASFQQILHSSLISAFHCTKEFEKIIMKEGKGKIIYVPSVTPTIGTIREESATVAKTGLVSYAKTLSVKYGQRFPGKVQVNVMLPLTLDNGEAGVYFDVGETAVSLALNAYETGKAVYF